MPKRRLFNRTLIKKLAAAARSRWQLLVVFAVLAVAAIGYVQYQRSAAERAEDEAEERWASAPEAEAAAGPTQSPPSRDSAPAPERRERPLLKARVVNAAWYDVPDASLAKRRAGEHELTAAHNRLPIGTLVRVTNLTNGKSVIVRITDRGIRDRRVKIDLCKEAAEELEMVRKGIARVRMEVLPGKYAAAAPADSYTAAPHP